VGLDVRDDGVLLQIRDRGRIVTRRSEYVLCTAPFSVVRRMRLRGFSSDKTDVVRRVRYVPATKVAFHCRAPFWEWDGIAGGASYSGGRVRQTYYPPVNGDPARGAVLLASYTIGADADALGSMDRRSRHAEVLAEVGRMHPELLRPGMVRDTVSLAWGRHPWSTGGCAVRWGMDAAMEEQERRSAAEPQGTLFFAGEHCSSAPAWIEGAIESAFVAVSQIALHEPGMAAADACRCLPAVEVPA
jgi:monoamine oxidase